MLVSYDFNSLYPSGQTVTNGTCLKIETAYPFKKYMSDGFCNLFISGRWNEQDRCAFITVKYLKPDILVLQHFPVTDKITNSYKNNTLEGINRMRVGVFMDTITRIDILEIAKSGGFILEVFEGFLCHIIEFNPFMELFNDMYEKIDLFKARGRDLLQNLAEKFGLSVHDGEKWKGINEECKCVTYTWMTENVDHGVKGWFPLKNGCLIVKLVDDKGVDDYDEAKLVKSMPSRFGTYILSHSKRLMKDVINK